METISTRMHQKLSGAGQGEAKDFLLCEQSTLVSYKSMILGEDPKQVSIPNLVLVLVLVLVLALVMVLVLVLVLVLSP